MPRTTTSFRLSSIRPGNYKPERSRQLKSSQNNDTHRSAIRRISRGLFIHYLSQRDDSWCNNTMTQIFVATKYSIDSASHTIRRDQHLPIHKTNEIQNPQMTSRSKVRYPISQKPHPMSHILQQPQEMLARSTLPSKGLHPQSDFPSPISLVLDSFDLPPISDPLSIHPAHRYESG